MNRTFIYAALVLLLVFFSIPFSRPLWDIDTWWHLSTGRYIVEHRQLLETDPFTFTYNQEQSYRTVLLNGYWLGQVILYLAYSAFGFYGLIVFRVLLLTSILLAIFWAGRKNNAEYCSIFIMLVIAGFAATHFTAVRPQLFSFLLAPVVVCLLDSIGKTRLESDARLAKPAFIALPAVMLLWANLHRGFMMGTALIMLFGFSKTVALIYRKKRLDRSFIVLVAVIAAAVAASLLNPNTFRPYIEILQFEGSVLQQRVSEYSSPVTLALKYGNFMFPFWSYLLLCSLVLARSFRKLDGFHLVLLVFLAAISISAFRYISFLIFTTSPFMAFYLSEIFRRRERLLRGMNVLAAALLIFASAYCIPTYGKSLGRALENPVKEKRYPEGAATFILENAPSGRIFNHYDWGGYLTWRLHPEYKVFIDGRAISLRAFRDYTYILWDRAVAQKLLDSHGVKIVIIPERNPFTSEPYELPKILQNDKQWRLVFRDTALVFLRGGENRRLMERFSLPASR